MRQRKSMAKAHSGFWQTQRVQQEDVVQKSKKAAYLNIAKTRLRQTTFGQSSYYAAAASKTTGIFTHKSCILTRLQWGSPAS